MDNEIFVLSVCVIIAVIRLAVGFSRACKAYEKHAGLLLFEGVNE